MAAASGSIVSSSAGDGAGVASESNSASVGAASVPRTRTGW